MLPPPLPHLRHLRHLRQLRQLRQLSTCTLTRCPILHTLPAPPSKILHVRSVVSHARFLSTASVHAALATDTSIAITDPLMEYQRLVATGEISYDEQQMRAVVQLRNVYRQLLDYEPPREFLELIKQLNMSLNEELAEKDPLPPSSFPTWFQPSRRHLSLVNVLSNEDEIMQLTTPKGLMLCGEVGTGKTMLMQLFYDTMPTSKKRRYHYHAFMLDIYAQIHRYQLEQQQRPDEDVPTNLVNEYVLLKIARNIMRDSWLICFDEFQMTDIATAAIMKQLFLYFFKMGGVIIATSNRIPDDLYKNGFQRQTYSAFLDLLQERCVVHDMRSKVDYRRVLAEQAKDDVTPLRKTYFRDTPEERRELDAVVMELVGQHKRK